VQKIKDMLDATVVSMGYEIWAVQLSSDERKTLRILIDGPDGVGSDACGAISRQVASILDVENPITGQYLLEVSSPGMNRPLMTTAHFTRYIGQEIKVRMRVPQGDRRIFRGTLKAASDASIDLALADDENDSTVSLSMQAIDRANLIPNFS
jgi:ribosome maturation factor RimP